VKVLLKFYACEIKKTACMGRCNFCGCTFFRSCTTGLGHFWRVPPAHSEPLDVNGIEDATGNLTATQTVELKNQHAQANTEVNLRSERNVKSSSASHGAIADLEPVTRVISKCNRSLLRHGNGRKEAHVRHLLRVCHL